MPPLVSVIIPAYNQARFIRQTIDSVFAQVFTDYELIVVNDGSTDETSQILAGYGDRIRVITQANAGVSAARNAGLRLAQGDMVALLDADDVWYPTMLAVLVSYLKKNPEIDLVGGAWDLINESGLVIRRVNSLAGIKDKVGGNFLRTIAVGNFIIPSALLIRRRLFDCCGLFDPLLAPVEDWEWLVKVAAHGHRLDLIDAPVLHYRRHSGCATYNPERMEQASRRAVAKIFSYQQIAAQIVDLEKHAYIYAWLSIAGYCQEAGLSAEVQRFVQMAGQHYRDASPNLELSLNYLNKLSHLPDTEQFMQIIVQSFPKVQPVYYWLMARRWFQRGVYILAFIHLFSLIVSQPGWLIKKIGSLRTAVLR